MPPPNEWQRGEGNKDYKWIDSGEEVGVIGVIPARFAHVVAELCCCLSPARSIASSFTHSSSFPSLFSPYPPPRNRSFSQRRMPWKASSPSLLLCGRCCARCHRVSRLSPCCCRCLWNLFSCFWLFCGEQRIEARNEGEEKRGNKMLQGNLSPKCLLNVAASRRPRRRTCIASNSIGKAEAYDRSRC